MPSRLPQPARIVAFVAIACMSTPRKRHDPSASHLEGHGQCNIKCTCGDIAAQRLHSEQATRLSTDQPAFDLPGLFELVQQHNGVERLELCMASILTLESQAQGTNARSAMALTLSLECSLSVRCRRCIISLFSTPALALSSLSVSQELHHYFSIWISHARACCRYH